MTQQTPKPERLSGKSTGGRGTGAWASCPHLQWDVFQTMELRCWSWPGESHRPDAGWKPTFPYFLLSSYPTAFEVSFYQASKHVTEKINRSSGQFVVADQFDHHLSSNFLFDHPNILVLIDSEPTALDIDPDKAILQIKIRLIRH